MSPVGVPILLLLGYYLFGRFVFVRAVRRSLIEHPAAWVRGRGLPADDDDQIHSMWVGGTVGSVVPRACLPYIVVVSTPTHLLVESQIPGPLRRRRAVLVRSDVLVLSGDDVIDGRRRFAIRSAPQQVLIDWLQGNGWTLLHMIGGERV